MGCKLDSFTKLSSQAQRVLRIFNPHFCPFCTKEKGVPIYHKLKFIQGDESDERISKEVRENEVSSVPDSDIHQRGDIYSVREGRPAGGRDYRSMDAANQPWSSDDRDNDLPTH